MQDDSGVWRCTLCAWEIETDDGLKGYCAEGHLFDCTNIPNFEALDKEVTDHDSIVSSEGWDEYEEDDAVIDEDIEDPYLALIQSIKDIDTSSLDNGLLTRAFKEIDAVEDGYKVLIDGINSIDMVDADIEDSEEDDEVLDHEEDKVTSEEDGVVNDEEDLAVEGEDIASNDEEEGSEEEETASAWDPEVTSEEDDSESEEEEVDKEPKKEENVGSAGNLTSADVEKLKDTIKLLTKLSEGLSTTNSANLAQRPPAAKRSQPSPLPFPRAFDEEKSSSSKAGSKNTKLDSGNKSGDEVSKQPLLFDPKEIVSTLKAKDELIHAHNEKPPGNSDDEDEYEWDLEDLDGELVDAIEKARLARNEQKKREDSQRDLEAHY